jgi:hypothetical protein
VTGDRGIFFCPKNHLTSRHNYGNNFINRYLFFGYTPMTTKTLEQFTTELDAAFAGVSQDDLKKLLKSWDSDPDEDFLKGAFIQRFETWPDVLKDTVRISVEIDESLDGPHTFLCCKNAMLVFANLSCARLFNFDLRGANLYNADLSGADLSGAYLSGAYLSGADLSGVDLSGADLRYAKGLVDKSQNSKLTFGHQTAAVFVNPETHLPNDLLCCYFNPKLYQKDTENSITFKDFAEKFIEKYLDSSDPIVTPPGSRVNLNVSGDINAWVAAMLPALEKAWDAREAERNNNPTGVANDEFRAVLDAKGGNQQT